MKQYTITNEAKQNFIIPFEDTQIEVNLEFLIIPSCWIMSLTFRDETLINGLRLNSAIVSLDTFNLPFDIYIDDVNSIGIDPFDINNFEDGFYTFNVIDREELLSVRGYDVK